MLKQGLAPQETDGPSSLRDSSWADTPRGVAPWKPPIHNILAYIPNAELPQIVCGATNMTRLGDGRCVADVSRQAGASQAAETRRVAKAKDSERMAR